MWMCFPLKIYNITEKARSPIGPSFSPFSCPLSHHGLEFGVYSSRPFEKILSHTKNVVFFCVR